MIEFCMSTENLEDLGTLFFFCFGHTSPGYIYILFFPIYIIIYHNISIHMVAILSN